VRDTELTRSFKKLGCCKEVEIQLNSPIAISYLESIESDISSEIEKT
jgi:hypothetical protein